MTKQEWLNCKSINKLLDIFTDGLPSPSKRKIRLFSLACCKSVEHLLSHSLKLFELFIDDNKIIYYNFSDNNTAFSSEATRTANQAFYNIDSNIYCVCYYTASAARIEKGANAWEEEKAKQVEFFKDIYNPFLDKIYFCSEAKSIAQQVYNGDNAARFVLSDFLEEKGYPEEIVLHLKSGNHYKGCWLIDQILGKK